MALSQNGDGPPKWPPDGPQEGPKTGCDGLRPARSALRRLKVLAASLQRPPQEAEGGPQEASKRPPGSSKEAQG
eukprot:2281845-Pyramimonas_sp.AAC.1